MQIKKIIIPLMLLMLTACNTESKTLVFALDYSRSTGINEISRMKDLLSVARQGDKVIIFPIHGRTASAVPIADKTIPPCEDINCEREKSKMLNDIVNTIDDSYKSRSINSHVKSSTSILPIFSKTRMLGSNENISLFIISDMIEENTNLDFVESFPGLRNDDIVELAKSQLDQWKYEIDLEGQSVSVLIPGTLSGSIYDDSFHRKVILFWETFIGAAGGQMKVRYLS